MKEWIINILGVSVATLMADLVLSDGEISSFTKKIFSVISVLVIINPIIRFFDSNKVNDVLNYDFEIVETYNQNLFDANEDFIKNYIISCLEEKGYYNVKVDFEYNMSDNVNNIEKIIINAENLVINENAMHINKYEEIKNIVSSLMHIKKESIVINE